jgi:hypothetical protein
MMMIMTSGKREGKGREGKSRFILVRTKPV